MAKLLCCGDPTFGIAAAITWFVSGGFAMGGAVTRTRCMVVATLVSLNTSSKTLSLSK